MKKQKVKLYEGWAIYPSGRKRAVSQLATGRQQALKNLRVLCKGAKKIVLTE